MAATFRPCSTRRETDSGHNDSLARWNTHTSQFAALDDADGIPGVGYVLAYNANDMFVRTVPG